MLRWVVSAIAAVLIITPAKGQILEGLAGNAQLQREAESHFMDGLKLLLLDKAEEAARSFEKSLDINPSNATAHFKLAEIQMDRNDMTSALQHAGEAVRLDPSNHYFLELQAEVQEAVQDWKAAIKTWRKIGALAGQNPEEVRFSIARIFIDQKKYKDAIEELNRFEKEQGPSQELFQFRMELHLKRSDLKAAMSEGNAWLKAFPDDQESWASVCRMLLSNNRAAEAKEKIAELIRRFPDYPSAHLMMADLYLQEKNEAAAFREMRLAFESPDLPAGAKIEIVAGYLHGNLSQDDFQQAMDLCDLLIRVHPGEAKVYIVRGDLLNQAGKGRQAREMYLMARNKDRNNFGLWEQLVLIDLNLNEVDSLVIHTSEARQLFPNTPSFSFYNGLGLLMQKKYESAVEALEHAARISIDNRNMQLEIFSQLGDAYYNLKQLDKSFSSYDEALQLDSSNGHVLNNYSYFLSLEKTGLQKAVRMSTRLVQLFPEDPTYLDTHGWVLYQNGQFKEALGFLEKASKVSNSGVIWEHYGDALYRNGRQSEADEAWKKAMDLGGGTSPDLPAKIRDHKVY
jgi:tetratricopeptide (TPR) repeat protein